MYPYRRDPSIGRLHADLDNHREVLELLIRAMYELNNVPLAKGDISATSHRPVNELLHRAAQRLGVRL